MNFIAELTRDGKTNGLALKVSSLPIFSVEYEQPVIVPENEISRLGFFNITYEQHYTAQQIESELARLNKNANAYRPIRTKTINLFKPYRTMHTTTFQSYKIPEELVRQERRNCFELASCCTS